MWTLARFHTRLHLPVTFLRTWNPCLSTRPSCGDLWMRRGVKNGQWKEQRVKDIYADRAIREGLRSRAAYKLQELNTKCKHFLQPGAYVVDLGAAPGGFSLIAAKLIRVDDVINRWDSVQRMDVHKVPMETERTLGGSQSKRTNGQLVCVDRNEMERVAGAIFVQGDLRDALTQRKVQYALASHEADVVLSDMAPDTISDKGTNHVRIMELAEEALRISKNILRNGGTLVCKVFSGADEREFRNQLRECFAKVRAVRPKACRKKSSEIYYVAQGFVPKHFEPREVERVRESGAGAGEEEGDGDGEGGGRMVEERKARAET